MKKISELPGIAAVVIICGCLAIGGNIAQAQTIEDVLGNYEVFLTNNAALHGESHILILRSGKVGPYPTYGLAFVTNRGGVNQGDGIVCEEATLILDRTAITCTKLFRNANGLIIGEESLTIAVTESPYCDALRATLPMGDQDKIADTMAEDCDKDVSGEQCICYDLKARGSTNFGPPSPGSGSGRRG